MMNYEIAEDKDLVSAIRDRDRMALEALYARYSGAVYGLAMRMLRDAGAAEEVAQDTFFNIWRRAGSYESPRGSVTAWLFGIARNRAIDELRKKRRAADRVQSGVDLSARPAETRDSDPTEYAAVRHEGRRVRAALATLRPEQRQVVALAYFGGMTQTQISQELDQPLGTVKTRMRLAIKKLRRALEPSQAAG